MDSGTKYNPGTLYVFSQLTSKEFWVGMSGFWESNKWANREYPES